jgi:NADPH-dependent 7-cyano-7-deazaguanine reductase QueF
MAISDEAYQAASRLYESIHDSGIHHQMAVAEAFHRLNELCDPEQLRVLLDYLALDEKLVDRQLCDAP